MDYTSLDFAFFLPVVFILYWFVFNKNYKTQNVLILATSYFFYGWWDWRFLFLIIFSTVIDYFVAIALDKEEKASRRKGLLIASLVINLGLLGVFKYYNFFVDSFSSAFSFLGSDIRVDTLSLILPVGISFYTFQTLSYTIDVYRKGIKPTNDFIAFAGFVSFFPQLIAGPIERARTFLPQFVKERTFNYQQAVLGLKQILWGVVKKVLIADNCGKYVDQIFANSDNASGGTMWLGLLLFAVQLYTDFSGYSDIAIGTAKLFDFKLRKNFAFPFFSRDIAEFWNKWHISLTTWFRDYIAVPLNKSGKSRLYKLRNIFIVFFISGLWHGANWTYITWGLVHALYFLPIILWNSKVHTGVVAKGRLIPSIKDTLLIIKTFFLITITGVFFRAASLAQSFDILPKLFSKSAFSRPELLGNTGVKLTIFFTVLFMILEWLGREDDFAIERIDQKWPSYLRYSFYYLIIIIVFIFGGQDQTFIYFQF